MREQPHWGLRWSSPWGHETLSWVGGPHARATTGALGGAPYGATKRCPEPRANTPTGVFCGAPYG
eukprot:7347085-Pyramimonas_sp.AAC.1